MKKNKPVKDSIAYFLPGIALISISLGSIFSIDLVRYGYFILITVFLVVLHYFNSSLTAHYKNKKMKKAEIFSGFIGVALIGLFFGMQSPQLPFKTYILIFGVVLLFIVLIKLKKG